MKIQESKYTTKSKSFKIFIRAIMIFSPSNDR